MQARIGYRIAGF